MRILLTTHELTYNGACVGLVRAAEYLIGRGHSVTICAPENYSAAFMSQYGETGFELAHTIAVQDYDAAVVNTLGGCDTVLRLAPALPVLWWIREGPFGARFAFATPAVSKAFAVADKVLFNSPFLADEVYRSFVFQLPAERIAVIANGIPPKPKEVLPAAKTPGRFRILCVATVYPRKRQYDLVKAVIELKRPEAECWMVGEVHEAPEEVLASIRQAPEVFHLTGPLPRQQVHNLYASADLYCLPSADESIARSPLEAGQHGLPSVLSDLPAYRGVWQHGRDALLYPMGDIRMLVWMLRMLIEDATLRQRLGEAARKTAARFDDGPGLAAVEAAIAEAVAIRRAI